MAAHKAYDCIVIGGGHNGLVAAAYLARAGKSVCVLERRHVLGGCASSESLWPGYRVSTAAYVISLLLPEIIRDLRLKHYGLQILPRDPSSFTPAARRPFVVDGSGRTGHMPRDCQVQSAGCGAISALHGGPGADRPSAGADSVTSGSRPAAASQGIASQSAWASGCAT